MTKIITLCGSNSKNSINRKLLEYAITCFKSSSVIHLEVSDYPMPIYCIDIENETGFPENTHKLRNALSDADGIVIVSPEHNGGMPAVLKNAIDWMSRVADKDSPILFNKPTLLISTSPGVRGGSTNLKTMSALLPYWGASSVDSYSLVSFYDNFSDGKLSSEENEKLVAVVESFEGKLIK